jgi:hypothetical protein
MKILDIPKENRPRERFLKQGPEALSYWGGRGGSLSEIKKHNKV